MGNYMSTSVDDCLKKNQEYVSELQKIKLERQIEMRYEIARRHKSLEIAKSRELFFWISAFYGVTIVGALSKFRRTKTSTSLTPIVPVSFLWAYYCDLAYGTKIHRIRAEAEMIMNNENELLEWPCDIPSVSEIDIGRENSKEFKKIHPPSP